MVITTICNVAIPRTKADHGLNRGNSEMAQSTRSEFGSPCCRCLAIVPAFCVDKTRGWICLPSVLNVCLGILGEGIDLGIPSRLPAASRPNPKPISDKHLRELGIAAKQLFPIETSFSFRVGLQFVNETGCRGPKVKLIGGLYIETVKNL
jgi:hypothetical protein